MDMAVTNLFLPDREKMISCLELFAANLKKWELMEDLHAIPTASIPVIKAIVDLQRLRDTEMKDIKDKPESNQNDFGQTQGSISEHEESKYSSNESKKSKNAPIAEHLVKLKIDITFDDNENQATSLSDLNFLTRNQIYGLNVVEKTHQGLASCNLIKSFVDQYKCLKEVAIILKKFLAVYNLNSPYQGKFVMPYLICT